MTKHAGSAKRTPPSIDIELDVERFRSDLLAWFDKNQRDLPWRRTRDPYAIWISEIMLQQTRVSAVIPFYERFLQRFPTFAALAAAPESELLACWAGLGYYYRARNLQRAAILMRDAGAFPNTYEPIRSLPGIGDYTAAAISSIAFDLPHAAVDGNGLRVLSRVFDDPADIASSAGRKHFAQKAAVLVHPARSGAFNQAVMELGATVCLPRKPQCLICPISPLCQARRRGTQDERPVSGRKMTTIEENRALFWITQSGSVLAWQRPAASRLMPGFWELPEQAHLPDAAAGERLGTFRHTITFHKYRFDIHRADIPADIGPCEWIPLDAMASMPVSTVMRKALRIAGRNRSPRATLRSSTASV